MRESQDTGSACVMFRLGRQGFGLPMTQISEIAAAGRITPVPLAPPVIRGLANLRGRVVTLIDVATVFSRPLPPSRFAEDRLALILSSPWDHLGLYVHAPVEIGQATAESAVEMQTLSVGGGVGTEESSGVPSLGLASVAGHFVHMLSATELVAFCEARVLEGFRRRN